MHDEAKVAERAFRAGAHGYAVKNESSPHIVDAIRAVLAGKFYASSTLAAQLTERLFSGKPRGADGTFEELLSDRELEVFRMRGQGRSAKEIAHTLIDVVVDASECRPMRSMGEVAHPTKQERVECIAYI